MALMAPDRQGAVRPDERATLLIDLAARFYWAALLLHPRLAHVAVFLGIGDV
jgi:hypothetical protein